jgi:hypothetical protein
VRLTHLCDSLGCSLLSITAPELVLALELSVLGWHLELLLVC